MGGVTVLRLMFSLNCICSSHEPLIHYVTSGLGKTLLRLAGRKQYCMVHQRCVSTLLHTEWTLCL